MHEQVARAGFNILMAGHVYADPPAGAPTDDALHRAQDVHAAALVAANEAVAGYWDWAMKHRPEREALFRVPGAGFTLHTAGVEFADAFHAVHADTPYADWSAAVRTEAESIDARNREASERAARDYEAQTSARALAALEAVIGEPLRAKGGNLVVPKAKEHLLAAQHRADAVTHKAAWLAVIADRAKASADTVLA